MNPRVKNQSGEFGEIRKDERFARRLADRKRDRSMGIEGEQARARRALIRAACRAFR